MRQRIAVVSRAVTRHPRHLPLEVGVRARDGEAPQVAIHVDAERPAEGAHGAPQRQDRGPADTPFSASRAGLAAGIGGGAIDLALEPLHVEGERRSHPLVDDAGAPVFDDEAGDGDGHAARSAAARRGRARGR